MNNKQLSEYLYGVDAPKRCPKCQAVWPENANFCGYDGEKLIQRAVEDGCAKGGAHEWGIDGQHSNEYCKKCFISKPYTA